MLSGLNPEGDEGGRGMAESEKDPNTDRGIGIVALQLGNHNLDNINYYF